jgi:hypothetical protein
MAADFMARNGIRMRRSNHFAPHRKSAIGSRQRPAMAADTGFGGQKIINDLSYWLTARQIVRRSRLNRLFGDIQTNEPVADWSGVTFSDLQ